MKSCSTSSSIRQKTFHILLVPFFYRKKLFLQNTPVEFFGIPLNDEILLQAEAHLVLAACRRLVAEEVYQQHYSHLSRGNRPGSQVLQNFFMFLAALKMEVQEECFEAIINITDATRLAHVIQRLQEGKRRTLGSMVVLLFYEDGVCNEVNR